MSGCSRLLFLRRREIINWLIGVCFAPDGQIIASYDKIHMFDANVGDGHEYCGQTALPLAPHLSLPILVT